ncbi:unnamed protein product [Brachionus calyciflorus]|uniref:Uncharacterized protein n=1 Tax=Brachionus calyciflorus TaxID=104777 RepID=A0A814L017_9BILA|nr:unnamed protein product [Brachionus calyciflorus]
MSTYTLWTTVSTALIKGTNNYKYMHYKCIHYRTIDDLTTKSNRVRSKQAYIVKFNLNHERVNNITNQTEAAHKISQEDYIKHPSNRRLTDGEENEINSKFETGGDAKIISQHMSQKTGKW